MMVSLVELIGGEGDKPYAVQVDAYMISDDGLTIQNAPRSGVIRKFSTLVDATNHLHARLNKLKGWRTQWLVKKTQEKY